MTQRPRNQQSTSPQSAETQRRNHAGLIGGDAAAATQAAFAKAGFSDPTLVLRWHEIAGADLARIARPIRMTDGVLTLKAEPAAAVFLQHETRALCGRINTYLGRTAVTRLKFLQGSLAQHGLPRPRRPQPGEPPATDPVHRWSGPEGLKSALLGLARSRQRAAD